MQNDNRKIYIDYAKGIAIFSVVFGHILVNIGSTNAENYLNIVIGCFHMPLFFILSGYNFNASDRKFTYYLKKKMKSLLIPYIEFTILTCILFHGILNAIEGTLSDYIDYALEKRRLIGTIFVNSDSLFWPFWFLPVLFVTLVIFYLIIKLTDLLKIKSIYKELVRGFLMIISATINYECMKRYQLPFSLREAFLALPFVYIGYIMKQYKTILFKKVNMYVCFVIFGLGVYYNCKNDITVVMFNSNVTSWHRFYVVGIAGAVFFTLFCYFGIKKEIKWLAKIGKNSLYIYGYQYIVINILRLIYEEAVDERMTLVNNSFFKIVLDLLLTMVVLIVTCYVSEYRNKIIASK